MRQPVALSHACRLPNHGPTVPVSAVHCSRRGLMTAAWAMALGFDPPKLAVVIDKSAYAYTCGSIVARGEFALQLPCAAQAGLAFIVAGDTLQARDLGV